MVKYSKPWPWSHTLWVSTRRCYTSDQILWIRSGIWPWNTYVKWCKIYFQKDPFGTSHPHCGKSVNYICTGFIPNCHLSLEIDIGFMNQPLSTYGDIKHIMKQALPAKIRNPPKKTPKSLDLGHQSWKCASKFQILKTHPRNMPSVKRDQTICPRQVDFFSTADMLSTIP